ncbi:fibroblast growth factor 19 [Gouania willdenowi]|uniref:Fibroblast growth factor n=1 Tax=Gouania willdenowi TaxID=441366 RepID=A0A8C5GZ55_GOUWI|nr:fibroblast growth factor 19 [Gouania willdenowi]
MLRRALSASVIHLLFTVGCVCKPVSNLGWGQVVRLRHLYAARAGQHLTIGEDGQVQGSAQQIPQSLLEIHPVGPGRVVMRAVAAARFLCMESNGRLFSSITYVEDMCTFTELILPDGYSVYVSTNHGSLLSLGNQWQRSQGVDRGVPSLAQFLPRISTLDQAPPLAQTPPPPPESLSAPTEEPVDVMESFGKLSQMIHSPSFHER